MEVIARHRNKIKKSVAERVVFSIALLFFLLWALSLCYPLIWLLSNSFKTNLAYLDDLSKGLAFPAKWDVKNYAEAFKGIKFNDTTFFGMFVNSIWISLLSISINVFLSCCTGYVLSKYKFRGRSLIYTTAIICMTLPVFGTGGVTYTFVYVTGMYDTPLYVIFSALGAFGMRFLMMYGFFKGVSWEYAEAAFIDGARDFTVFFRIMIPLAFPMIFTLGISGFIVQWNSYESVLLYMPSYSTLAVGLYKIAGNFDSDKPVYYAAMIISLIPVLVLFSAFSDTIMKNFSVGGLKG